MIAIPAIDVRDGCCVQLVGGSFAHERIRLPNPVAAAHAWVDAGFRQLHVVDLDAALGVGSNLAIIERLVAITGAEVQVGGGIRSTQAIEHLLDAGASRVVLGTRALGDHEWLARSAARWPARIVVAADARHGRVVTHGWTTMIDDTVESAVQRLGALPLAGFLITAVDREGQMRGPDVALIARAARAATCGVIASGGIGSRADLCALATRGAAAAVIGMALYSGAFEPRAIASEFNQ
jgi:phosphoribosylformimino-5-aminoimidazole carboxamide ribotide isomerase